MIWSKLYVLPVDIPGQQANVPFRHVEEDMTVPIPKASELENYIVYIGFDPKWAAAGAAQEAIAEGEAAQEAAGINSLSRDTTAAALQPASSASSSRLGCPG